MTKRGFYDFPYKKRMAIESFRKDLAATIKSLGGRAMTDRQALYRLLTEHLSVVMIDWAAGVLDQSVGECPYETGALRASGGFQLKVGQKGTTAGGFGGPLDKTISVEVPVGKGYDGTYAINVDTWVVKKPASLLVGLFVYDRQAKGVDIALYTHENLEPYVTRPKTAGQKGTWYASKPGTKPKYLEDPINERLPRLRTAMRRATTRAIKIWNAKNKPSNIKKKRGKT